MWSERKPPVFAVVELPTSSWVAADPNDPCVSWATHGSDSKQHWGLWQSTYGNAPSAGRPISRSAAEHNLFSSWSFGSNFLFKLGDSYVKVIDSDRLQQEFCTTYQHTCCEKRPVGILDAGHVIKWSWTCRLWAKSPFLNGWRELRHSLFNITFAVIGFIELELKYAILSPCARWQNSFLTVPWKCAVSFI